MSTQPTTPDLETMDLNQLRQMALDAIGQPQPTPTDVQPTTPTASPEPEPETETVETDTEPVEDEVEPEPSQREYVQEIDLGDGSGVQVFRGRTKDDLIQKLVTAQTNATRKIRELSRRPEPTPPAPPAPTPEEEFLLGQELMNEPSKAFDKLFAKKMGFTPAQLQEKLAAVQKLERQQTESEISEQFIASTPEYYACTENFNKIDRYFKTYRLEPTLENLQSAYNELNTDGLLVQRPQDEPAGDPAPEPTPERIAQPVRTAPLRRQAASGLSSRRASAPRLVAKPGPTEEELESMSTEQLEQLARRAYMSR